MDHDRYLDVQNHEVNKGYNCSFIFFFVTFIYINFFFLFLSFITFFLFYLFCLGVSIQIKHSKNKECNNRRENFI